MVKIIFFLSVSEFSRNFRNLSNTRTKRGIVKIGTLLSDIDSNEIQSAGVGIDIVIL